MSVGKLLFAISGIYISYLTYGIIQEYIFLPDEDGNRFSYTLTLLFIQCVANALCAVLCLAVWPPTSSAPSHARYFALPAASYIGAMLCSNEALKYVNYPTQALAKSCKMLPVMAAQVLVFGKRYSLLEYLYVVLVTAGIIVFRWKGGSSTEENSSFGLLLLFGSLCLDGLTGPLQERLRQHTSVTAFQLQLYINMFAMLYLAVTFPVVDGLDGFIYLSRNSTILSYIIVFSFCSSIGQIFIFYTLTNFGALTLTTVTTTRKFFTILASVVFFGNVLTSQQWSGVALVFCGLGIEVVTKYRKSQASRRLPQKPADDKPKNKDD